MEKVYDGRKCKGSLCQTNFKNNSRVYCLSCCVTALTFVRESQTEPEP